MSKPLVAFLASANYTEILAECPGCVNEFNLFKEAFLTLGQELVAVDWKDPSINWKQFSRVVPKAAWDYAESHDDFLSFLERLQYYKIECRNSVNTLIWNMRKTYLLDLKARGLNVAELRIFSRGSKPNLEAWAKGLSPEQNIVLKPSISGGARDTVRCTVGELTKQLPLIEKILAESDLIFQPYFGQIATHGEYSFFFFDGEYSHAILKKPARGDFRAHPIYGALTTRHEASAAEIAEAKVFVEAVKEPCAYARVDGFKSQGKLLLLELELIEPYLYFEQAPKSSVLQFCRAVLR